MKLELGAVDGSEVLIECDLSLLRAVEHNDTVCIRCLNAHGLAILDRKRKDTRSCRGVGLLFSFQQFLFIHLNVHHNMPDVTLARILRRVEKVTVKRRPI